MNISQSGRLKYQCEIKFSHDNLLIYESRKNYIVSIVSAIETFYRDLFIFCLENDKNFFLDKISKEEKYKLYEIHKYITNEISFSDIVADSHSFTNIKNINQAFSGFFEKDYTKEICSCEEHVIILSTGEFKKINLQENWVQVFNQLFLRSNN